MKKKWVYIIIAFLVIIGGSALAMNLVNSANGPTGHPEGEIQREFLFHDGTLFIYEGDYTKNLPTNATEVGKIKRIDNKSIPQEEMVASRLEAGLNVYSIGSKGSKKLVVKINDSRYETFVPFEGDPEDWQ